ncbi:MAG TPA: oxidoreductase, partial [Planctomycetaceae bacterium]|nr:oxidoreductase [Planctomycetaceae bacterium]
LKVGFIGVGGRGGSNLRSIAKDPDVVVSALCDVNAKNLIAAAKLFPDARQFVDFRELYRRVDDLDAVVVSVPEHTHAYATLPALRRGWHVYCEKPLTHNIAEARLVTETAKAAGVATQMGTQIHAGENYHRVVRIVQSGILGDVREVHTWVGRAWGLQSEADAKTNKDLLWVDRRPTEIMQPPEYLDWDAWLGPAPYRPYHEVYFPGPKWYRWWDFGSGTMSDLGSHWVDLPFWAMQLDAPQSIVASGPPPHPEIAPASMQAKYQYASRRGQDAQGQAVPLPPCELTWYQGKEKPEIWKAGNIPQWSSGCLFIGSSAKLIADYGKFQLLSADGQPLDAESALVKDPAVQSSVRVPEGHHADWLAGCRTGAPTGSPFSYAGPLTEANHLGNVAYRSGTEIRWDAAAMKVINSSLANQLLSRSPRGGWSLDAS